MEENNIEKVYKDSKDSFKKIERPKQAYKNNSTAVSENTNDKLFLLNDRDLQLKLIGTMISQQRYLKSISNNVKFFFWITIISIGISIIYSTLII